MSLTILNAGCFCDQLHASVEIPSANLPLAVWMCHCDTCRRITGQLGPTNIYLPKDQRNRQVHGITERFDTGSFTRCFCGNCGTSVFDIKNDDGSWASLGAGSLQNEVKGNVEFTGHLFVEDARDGGLRDWLPNSPAWKGMIEKSECIPSGQLFEKLEAVASDTAGPADKLPCACHCGGVQFDITRPKLESYNLSSPFCDSLIPYYEGPASNNPHDVKWWISRDNYRFMAVLCMCDTCRKASGHDIQSWAFVPKVNMQSINGGPIDFEAGTIKHYKTSNGVIRDFCGTCGAVLFYRRDGNPELVDVSVGLTKSHAGARAEDWFEWYTKRVSFIEFAKNNVLAEALDKGMQGWSAERQDAREAKGGMGES